MDWYYCRRGSFALNLHDDGPGARANLVPVREIDAAELPELHYTIDNRNGHRAPHDDRADMAIRVQAPL